MARDLTPFSSLFPASVTLQQAPSSKKAAPAKVTKPASNPFAKKASQSPASTVLQRSTSFVDTVTGKKESSPSKKRKTPDFLQAQAKEKKSRLVGIWGGVQPNGE